MTESASLSIVTWNVRHCLGFDRRVTPGRILEVLARLGPDVVALQEVDVRRLRSGFMDQPAWLAMRLGMQPIFCETTRGYGHAVLTRLPVERVERIALPAEPSCEPRAALDLVLGPLRVLATHMSLSAPDRTAQARVIAARLARAEEPFVVVGDLNAGPRQLGYEELMPMVRDPLAWMPRYRRCTWPAFVPLRAFDHVLLSPSLRARHAYVLGGPAVLASDHRAVVAEVVMAR